MSLEDFNERIAAYSAASHAPATRTAFATDWRIFTEFCNELDAPTLPAEPSLVAAFLTFEADDGRAPATLIRRLAAIRFYHLNAGHPSPTYDRDVQLTIAGIKRTKGVKQAKKKALTIEQLGECLPVGHRLIDIRDRAVLLLWFGLAARRSEMAALRAEDIAICQEGLRINFRKSQTDQEMAGAVVAVPTGEAGMCPVAALLEWIKAANITNGPLFRWVRKNHSKAQERPLTPQALVSCIIKKHVKRIGIDPRDYAGHSLRCAFVTAADASGASWPRIMDVSRHALVDSVRACVRPPNDFEDHPNPLKKH